MKTLMPSRSRGLSVSSRPLGFTLLGLLLVLAIIAILMANYFEPGPGKEGSLAQVSIDRSKAVACVANATSYRSAVQMWTINHPGEAPTRDAMAQSGVNAPSCPEGGEYSLGPNGEVYCSIHDPAPTPTATLAPVASLEPAAGGPDAPAVEPASQPAAADSEPAAEKQAMGIGHIAIQRARQAAGQAH
jgi:competence protein ComGC